MKHIVSNSLIILVCIFVTVDFSHIALAEHSNDISDIKSLS